jgi:hypothetical protein
LSSGALKKPDDQSSGSPKSSDTVDGSGQTSPKNDGDAIASSNDDVQSHSPPPGVDESCTSPKDDAHSHSPPKGAPNCAEGNQGTGDSTRSDSVDKSSMPPKANSPSVSTAGTKSPIIGSTHSYSPSKDVDESCVPTPSESGLQGDSLNTTMTGFDVITPLSALRQVASKASSHFIQATIRKGRRSFGQLKDNIGKLMTGQDRSSPSQHWSQELAPTIMNVVQDTFWEVGAKYPVFSPDNILRVSIWFVENDVELWDKLQVRVEDICLGASFEKAIWEIINIGSSCFQDTRC